MLLLFLLGLTVLALALAVSAVLATAALLVSSRFSSSMPPASKFTFGGAPAFATISHT